MILGTLALMCVWMVLQGQWDLQNAVYGAAMGFLLTWWLRPLTGRPALFRVNLPAACRLFSFFLKELVVSNVQVLAQCVRPGPSLVPSVLVVPMQLRHDGQQALLANLVTLTPGTLSLEVQPSENRLIVHSLFASEQTESGIRKTIAEFERLIEETFR